MEKRLLRLAKINASDSTNFFVERRLNDESKEQIMNTSSNNTQNLPPSDCNREARNLGLLEQRLEAIEARNRQLLASLPQIVWFAQLNGEITEFNPRWYEYTGLTPVKSLGWEFLNALHPEDRDLLAAALRDRFVTLHHSFSQIPQPYELECRILGKDQKYQGFRAQITPVTRADGQIYEWLGTCTLTDRVENLTPCLIAAHSSLPPVKTASKSPPRSAEKQHLCAVTNKQLNNTDELAKYRIRNLAKELAHTIVWEASATTAEYTFVSQNAEKVLGYPVQKWLTEPNFWVNLIHPEDRQWTVALSDKEINHSRDYELEYRCVTADQRVVWLRDRAFVIRDEQGRVQKRRGMMVDITLAKQAQAELHVRKRQQTAIVQLGQKAVLGSISALMNEGVALVSQTLAVEYSKILEYVPDGQNLHLRAGVGWQEGLVGQATVEASADTHAGYTLHCRQPIVFEDLRREKRFRGSALLHDHGVVSGMSVVIEAKSEQVSSAKSSKRPFGILGAHSNRRRKFSPSDVDFLQAVAHILATAITEQKSDQALAEARIQLAQTQAALEKRNQEFEQFTYVASHDLRAPLRAIANLSQWIEEDIGEQLDQENQHQMQLLRGRVYRLEAMFEGLLGYSRAGLKTEPQWVDVGVLLQEVIADLAPPANFTIEVAPMPRLYTKRCQLRQVFSHLIRNAIAHHPSPEGTVKISAKPELDGYEFTVSDDGVGIAAQFQERVFEIFQTLQARDTVENIGMGLAIVKKIVESQNGTIRLESQAGKGANFSFTWRDFSREN